jgi:hypothetical protein
MEAKNSSETSVDYQRTTWRYIPEDTSVVQKVKTVWLLQKINEQN